MPLNTRMSPSSVPRTLPRWVSTTRFTGAAAARRLWDCASAAWWLRAVAPSPSSADRRRITSAAADPGHLRRHDGDELDACLQREVGHQRDLLADVIDVHPRLDLRRAVRLWHAFRHP